MYACTYICANVSNTQEGVALYSNAQEGYAQKRATPIKERKCQSIDCKRERVGCSNDIGGFHEKFTPPPPLLHTNRERGIYQLQRELPHGTEIERKKISIQACIYIYIYMLMYRMRTRTTGWRRPIGCLKLHVIVRERATNYRAFLRKTPYKDKASYGSSPPCTTEGKKERKDIPNLLTVWELSHWTKIKRNEICARTCVFTRIYIYMYIYADVYRMHKRTIGWLRLVGSFKL